MTGAGPSSRGPAPREHRESPPPESGIALTSWLPSMSLPAMPSFAFSFPSLGFLSKEEPGEMMPFVKIPEIPPRRPPSPIREDSQATIRPSRPVLGLVTTPSPRPSSTFQTPSSGSSPRSASEHDVPPRSLFRAFRSPETECSSKRSSSVSTRSTLSRVSTRMSELCSKPQRIRVGSRGVRAGDRILPDDLVCVQQLTPPAFAVTPAGKQSKPSRDAQAVLAMVESQCGRWLATGGRSQVVYIWQRDCDGFVTLPHRAFIGHEGEILDLAWSKGGFLLSCGMDRAVRIWHPQKDECLGVFMHDDFVTSVAFNPVDDRLLATASLDRKLRIWSAPDGAVLCQATTASIPTAVAFRPDGTEIVTGGLKGDMTVWTTDDLRSQQTVKVRSTRGKNNRSSKITSITYTDSIVVSSNDSRIRLYSPDLKLRVKFKGHQNQSSHIRASTQQGRLASGSEDGYVYIWDSRQSRTSYEYFQVGSACAAVCLCSRYVLCATQDGRLVYMHDGPPPANWPDGITFLHKSRRSPCIPRAHLPLIPACAPCTHPSHLRIRQITDIGHPANGQYGLFTTKKIPPRTLILPYLGLIHGPSELHAASDYDLSLVRLGPVHPLNPTPGTAVELAIDADKMGNAARMVNDYRGTGAKVNAEFRVVDGRMELWSLAVGVPKGEILVSYGKGFWQSRNA